MFVLSLFCYSKNVTAKWSLSKQDSPPAWTQEAYRPLCGKHTLCYPRWGGVPTLVGGGTYSGGGVPTLVGGGTYPGGGVPTLVGGYLL